MIALIPAMISLPLLPNIKKPIIPNSLIPAGKAFTTSINPPIPAPIILNTICKESNNLATPSIACFVKFINASLTLAENLFNVAEFSSIDLFITTNAFFIKSKNPARFVSN